MVERLDEETLVSTLNLLITSFEIPTTLETPLDLTPKLILAIFESMLRTRLPISAETRASATRPVGVEAMKIFLGVLEDDVLGIDVGLEQVDPRRLADGEWEEVVFVAEVLCWLGKKMNYLSGDRLSISHLAASRDAGAPSSPSLRSSVSTSHHSSLSMHPSFAESQTTVSQGEFDEIPPDESFVFPPEPSYHHTENLTESFAYSPPRRIFEVSDFPASPSRRGSRQVSGDVLGDHYPNDSICDCPSEISGCSTITVPVRSTGFLNKVDFESELRSFEEWKERTELMKSRSRIHSQSRSKPRLSGLHTPPARNSNSQDGIVTRHTSPYQHTLALMEERARLLSELSKIKRGRG